VIDELGKDVDAVQAIPAVREILDVVCGSTGMGFAAVARVTEDRWIACQVLDKIGFGIAAGGELQIETTICNELREHHRIVVIADVDEDPLYRDHPTPRMYGLKSYLSVPIILPDGFFFGTLFAVDPKPAKIDNPETIGTFRLFANLIGYYLQSEEQLREAHQKLADEKKVSELREQFVAVLGHDLRNPIAALDAGLNRLLRHGWTDTTPEMLRMMKTSIRRMTGLVENVMDLARARLGAGIEVIPDGNRDVAAILDQVIEELRTAQPERKIESTYQGLTGVSVDPNRFSQMFSNLLGNALTHGAADQPISIEARADGAELSLAVGNGGEPIPSEALARLFQPFERGENRGSQGLGLGLYIASEIAKAHGGTLEVLSDERQTSFTFRMPVQIPHVHSKRTESDVDR
jgi:signal transduction histidine kinase